MSSQYENEVAKWIHRRTNKAIRSYRCGYSGSNAMPQPDVLVTTPQGNYGLELKGPIASDRLYIDEEDLEQLVECANWQTKVYLVVKFQRRKPLVIRWYDDVVGENWKSMSLAEKFAAIAPDEFDPKATDSGNLRLVKPDTDSWPSASAMSVKGDEPAERDAVSVLGTIGVPIKDIIVAEDSDGEAD